MWFIVRKKESVNNILKDFHAQHLSPKLRVRDIIKFGRVNFKITEMKCDRMDSEYTGTCHSDDLSTMLFKQKVSKGSNVKHVRHDSSGGAKLNTIHTEISLEDQNPNEISIIGNNVTDMHLVTNEASPVRTTAMNDMTAENTVS
jgi:hypothetical protein